MSVPGPAGPVAARSSAPLATSTSLCPTCFAEIPCQYVARDGRVYQAKSCPEHGATESLYWHDEAHFEWMRSYGDADASQACCDGAPGRSKCLAVIDVTQACDLTCNYCFASSRPGLPHVPTDTVRGLLETVLRESGPTPIQFSGGEPTVRDDLPDLVAMARDMGFAHIEVNSNGVRLGAEPGLAQRLRDAGTGTVYLQFDGLDDKVHKQTRQAKLAKSKQKAIEACRAAGLQVILVPMVVPGINEHALGDIVRFALANLDVVRGVNFQPVSHFGRHAEDSGHLSLPEVARLLAEQTGFLAQKDLLQVPCCSPACSSATMLLSMGESKGQQKAIPLTRFLSDDAYRSLVDAFEETRFMDVLAGRPSGMEAAVDAAGCCGIPIPEGATKFLPRMLAVTVTGFMDADTVDLERLGSCCINVPTPEGRLVPFCGYNLTTRDGRYALRERYAQDAAACGPTGCGPGACGPVASQKPGSLPVLP